VSISVDSKTGIYKTLTTQNNLASQITVADCLQPSRVLRGDRVVVEFGGYHSPVGVWHGDLDWYVY